MPYVLNKSNGRVFVTIQDGSVDNSSSLTFIGKNYAGYGQILQQDLLYLLESFSNSTAPANPMQGQLWFDSGNLKLKVYDGTAFKGISFTTVSNSQPTTAQEGDFWFNTANSTLSIKVGDAFAKISGTSSSSNSGIILTSVKDTDGNSHTILKSVINSNTVSIFSYDSFAVNASESIYLAFPFLKKGLTLVSTDANGRTTTTSDGPIFWGTAATSLKADSLLVDSTSTFFTATTGTTANTVVARGSAGEIRASNFYNNVGLIGQGYWGSRGFTGSGAGFTGSQGTTGFDGSAGSVGPIGYTGSGAGGGGSGFTGSQGAIGFTGSGGGGGGGTGFTGSRGALGPQGPIGYVGSQGSAASAAPPVLYNVTSSPTNYTAGGAVFVSSTQPTALHVGDFWFDTTVTSSLGSSGWSKLPGGLTIQWGVTAVVGNTVNTITFPLAFSSACFSFTFSDYNTLPDNTNQRSSHSLNSAPTTTSARVFVSNGTSVSSIYWIAVGV